MENSKPFFWTGNVFAKELLVRFEQVENAFNKAYQDANATKKGQEQVDNCRVILAENQLVEPERNEQGN